MKLVAYEDLDVSPWKNGGGATRELACVPAGAGLSDFLWRVSIAEVSRSGPFSSFPGIDRIITLLEGDGMLLESEGNEPHSLTTPFAPYRFPGELAVEARLAGSPSLDLNLMMRRGAVLGEVKVWRAAGRIPSVADCLLLFCAQGRWEVSGAAGERHRLEPRQSMINAALFCGGVVEPLEKDAVLIGIAVSYVGAKGTDHADWK